MATDHYECRRIKLKTRPTKWPKQPLCPQFGKWFINRDIGGGLLEETVVYHKPSLLFERSITKDFTIGGTFKMARGICIDLSKSTPTHISVGSITRTVLCLLIDKLRWKDRENISSRFQRRYLFSLYCHKCCNSTY